LRGSGFGRQYGTAGLRKKLGYALISGDMRNLRLKPGRVGAYFTIGWCLARFQAKHALGLDPGVESGSRQENASNRESTTLSDSIETDKALADFWDFA
jgi:hypothetical protein